MEDFPWHIVVVVFILFIGWVRNRIREAAEARRERRAARHAEELAKRRGGTVPAPAPRQSPPPPQPAQPPKSFRDLFEEMQRQIEDSHTPPSQPSSPPPLPNTPAPGKIETPPAQREKEVPVTIPGPVSGPRLRGKKRKKQSELAKTLAGTLKDSKQLTNTLILKEVLDSPRALRPIE